ncbi:hypothetical protein [Clostridium sp. D53t1_180928_C8]|uniref:hypothetical protein n=1 Tax=Clostridium sp. D53t1_180928_C8 TaxID=2787101 RepID=UPI0018A8AF13|nr:hypothetical protein [Clostridium sp. D53t1_180928_C8]
MFNLIYLILGIYLIKLITIRISMEYKSIRNKEKDEGDNWRQVAKGKIKDLINEINNILKNNKNNNVENKIQIEEEWNLKRKEALQKAKYKCEECGNIANLDVYENSINNNEVIVLCKKCYEESFEKLKLHYE